VTDYRSVKVQMWRADEWFQDLPTDARLFWVYLFTNPSARVAGIYKLTTRTMCFESGLPAERIEELKAQFSKAGKAHFEDDVVWVVKMRELQSPGKISPKLQTGIDNDLAEIPPCDLKRQYMIRYGYPIDTISTTQNRVEIPITTYNTAQHSTTQSGAVVAGPLAPLPAVPPEPQDALAVCVEQLGVSGTNKNGAVGHLFSVRYGDTYKPDYGRLGKLANSLSGEHVTLAQLIWSSPVPQGDPHDYLTKLVQGSPAHRAPPGKNGTAPARGKVKILLSSGEIVEANA
jgi:hypothetical protein